MNRARIAVGGLALSAAAFVGILNDEWFTEKAVIPIKNDRPTVGFGSTFWEDGRPVKMGESITPVRAVRLASSHLAKEEVAFRSSLPGVALHQAEYDVYMDWVYQYGTGAWRASTMRTQLIAGQYRAACDALLAYRKAGGYDCSTPGNRICPGVWTRQLARHKKCLEAQ